MVVTALQLGEQLNAVSILPRLLALAWSAYYARTLRHTWNRSRGTCLPATGVSLAMVSTATATTNAEEEDIGAEEKKND